MFLCDAKLWTKGKTVQIRGIQSPDRKKEGKQSLLGQSWVCDLGQQRN